VAKKNTYSKVLAFALIIGVPTLLFVGCVYGILSDREWAFGVLGWFAIVLLWALVRKLVARTDRASVSERGTPVDEGTRKHLLRSIRLEKIWIGALAVCLPIGIVDGIAQHFYWQLLIGIGINLSLMYVAREHIKRLKSRVNISTLPANS
jgi:hypothetical protein